MFTSGFCFRLHKIERKEIWTHKFWSFLDWMRWKYFDKEKKRTIKKRMKANKPTSSLFELNLSTFSVLLYTCYGADLEIFIAQWAHSVCMCVFFSSSIDFIFVVSIKFDSTHTSKYDGSASARNKWNTHYNTHYNTHTHSHTFVGTLNLKHLNSIRFVYCVHCTLVRRQAGNVLIKCFHTSDLTPRLRREKKQTNERHTNTRHHDNILNLSKTNTSWS